MTKQKRAAIYLRVSTKGQTTENQLRELREVASNANWEIVEVYEDMAISGAKGRDQRPAFEKLHRDATGRKFDVVMAWSVDRLGRSLKSLLEFLEELKALNLDLYLHQQKIDTTTPAGRAMFGMLGVFADFERSMIQERVNAGLARAKAEGKTLGRPKMSDSVREDVLKSHAEGLSIRKIADKHKVSVGGVHKLLKETA